MIVLYILDMPYNLKKTDSFVSLAQEQIKDAPDVYCMRKCLAILLVNKLRCTYEDAAAIIGVSAPTITRLRKEFQRVSDGENSPRDDWGGRRHSFLTFDEEKKFLSSFTEKAKAGELVITASIREAFEQRIGKEVPKSTIARLLDRHRWRKLEPEPRHPDEDKVVQEAFKKKDLPKKFGRPATCWLPPDLCV
jgi:transposase